MKTRFRYKGYIAEAEYYPDDKAYSGVVVNITDTVHFQGTPSKRPGKHSGNRWKTIWRGRAKTALRRNLPVRVTCRLDLNFTCAHVRRRGGPTFRYMPS